jgi:polar amino acid transport system permease protein
MGYHIDFGLVLHSYPVLLRGLIVTIELWIPSIVIGFFVGLFLALARLSHSRVVRYCARGYIELFRDTPVLIQLIWFFYAFPIVIGVQLTPYQAALLGLALNTSAYSAEIFRGGIQSIKKGQWEGAKALGMRPAAVLRRIILPQVLKRMLPAFTNRAIEVAKMSSLASILTVAFVYFVLIFPGSYFSLRLERRLAKSQ